MRPECPSIVVLRAIPHEAAAIADVLRVAFARYEPLYTPLAYAATLPDATGVLARFEEGPIFVARAARNRGRDSHRFRRPGRIRYLRNVAVRSESSGRGIGRALVDAVIEHARRYGVPRIELCTARS